MQVTYAHICDYASISREGKLSAMGIFDRILLATLPGVHPLMYVALELALRPAELGRPFQLQVRLADQDGGVLMDVTGNGQITGNAQAGDVLRVPQILALAGVPLRQAGTYSLDIFVNGDHKHAVTFVVVSTPPGGTPAPPGLQQ